MQRRADLRSATLFIELTQDEAKLRDAIEFDANTIVDAGYERVLENGLLAERLCEALLEREAIPPHRLQFFTDPDCNIGRSKRSRKDGFEANYSGEGSIARHPHFLKYLDYFIHGPNLPAALVEDFRAEVDACGMLTSGDYEPLCKRAKALARSHGLGKASAEKFFQLALEAEISPLFARSFYDAVKQMR